MDVISTTYLCLGMDASVCDLALRLCVLQQPCTLLSASKLYIEVSMSVGDAVSLACLSNGHTCRYMSRSAEW